MARDLYQDVTDRILAALEAGTKPWECDWIRTGLPRRVTGEQYRGINILLLALTQGECGYRSDTWMTFNQAKAFGAAVRKGERGTPIVFFKRLERTEQDPETGEDREIGIPMIRGYTVFNVDQIDGLPDRFYAAGPGELEPKLRDELAEASIRSCGASIAEDGGDRAYYRPSTDSIHLPAFDRFKSAGGFLATMAHECVHWTGAPHRLDRTKGKAFGDVDYAFEELVAEIGAAMVCARLQIAGEHFDNHAAYVGSWLKVLRNDKRAIFRAASLAQAAADMVLAKAGLEPAGAVAERPAPAPAAPAAAAPALQLAFF